MLIALAFSVQITSKQPTSLPSDRFVLNGLLSHGYAVPIGTMKVLTARPTHPWFELSPLVSFILPDIPPPTTLQTRSSLNHCSVIGDFQTSPSPRKLVVLPRRIEFVAYGLPFRLGLLPTPSRDDAVNSGYEGLAYLDTDFHRAV